MTPLEDLKPGDRFRYPISLPQTVCEVVREVEPRKDVFGRDMRGVWVRAVEADDGAPVAVGAEGFVTFGPDFPGLAVLS